MQQPSSPGQLLEADPPAAMLVVSSIRSAESLGHHVDARLIADFPAGHPGRLVTAAAMGKWRTHATRNIVDDATRLQIPSGFVEVLP